MMSSLKQVTRRSSLIIASIVNSERIAATIPAVNLWRRSGRTLPVGLRVARGTTTLSINYEAAGDVEFAAGVGVGEMINSQKMSSSSIVVKKQVPTMRSLIATINVWSTIAGGGIDPTSHHRVACGVRSINNEAVDTDDERDGVKKKKKFGSEDAVAVEEKNNAEEEEREENEEKKGEKNDDVKKSTLKEVREKNDKKEGEMNDDEKNTEVEKRDNNDQEKEGEKNDEHEEVKEEVKEESGKNGEQKVKEERRCVRFCRSLKMMAICMWMKMKHRFVTIWPKVRSYYLNSKAAIDFVETIFSLIRRFKRISVDGIFKYLKDMITYTPSDDARPAPTSIQGTTTTTQATDHTLHLDNIEIKVSQLQVDRNKDSRKLDRIESMVEQLLKQKGMNAPPRTNANVDDNPEADTAAVNEQVIVPEQEVDATSLIKHFPGYLSVLKYQIGGIAIGTILVTGIRIIYMFYKSGGGPPPPPCVY